MISLAGRDILHAWGKFVFTGIGLGLLIGVTLTMAGVYRGMVDDAKVLLDNSRAQLWVVQKDTLGPYAEPSSTYDDVWRGIRGMDGGGIEYRDGASLGWHQQANLGAAEDHPFSPLLRQLEHEAERLQQRYLRKYAEDSAT